jgi:methyl-accepting chemotaxis protein
MAIGTIDGTIGEVSNIATAIAAAIEEQSAAVMEVTRNTQQAAVGTQVVNDNIAGVNGAASETGVAAGQVRSAAAELGQQAELLRAEVAEFLAQMRAA